MSEYTIFNSYPNVLSGLLTLFILYSFAGFVVAVRQIKKHNNTNGLSYFWMPIGAFVWADAVIFGLFWTLTGVLFLYLQDYLLLLLTYSSFWLVRSIGETIYWLLQQFSMVEREPIKQVMYYTFFKNDSVWFVHQVLWQVRTVVAFISTLILLKIWWQL